MQCWLAVLDSQRGARCAVRMSRFGAKDLPTTGAALCVVLVALTLRHEIENS